MTTKHSARTATSPLTVFVSPDENQLAARSIAGLREAEYRDVIVCEPLQAGEHGRLVCEGIQQVRRDAQEPLFDVRALSVIPTPRLDLVAL